MTAGNVPPDLRYTKSHEWIRELGDEMIVGITDHAQQELTDIVFVDLPKSGASVKAGASALVLESVKTVADVYAPFDGTVVAGNEALKAHPELVNRAPYSDGWLFKMRRTPSGLATPNLSAAEYEAFVAVGSPA
ncbi:MAG: glycine cleavage system protein GcvH [Thermoplasmata archaeon]|nr:glycine cleavage system protein GcvH [Thermoplasmata archaeon]